MISDFNYIQANFFDIFSYFYSYRNSLISNYFFVLFNCYPINNTKWVGGFFPYISIFNCSIVSSKMKFSCILESSMTRIPFFLVLIFRIMYL
jgi:hypothetical protein